MNSKPYLISAASLSLGVEGYLDSLKNLKDSVDWLSVEFYPDFGPKGNIDSISNYSRIKTNTNYPGHLGRFNVLLDLVNDGPLADLDPKCYWIFTDTADVRFQAPVPNLDTSNDIIAVSEGILHKDNGWWTTMIEHFPVFKPLLIEPVYNMGCVAMRGEVFTEFLNYLREMQRKHDLVHNCDQALYNLFLLENRDRMCQHKTLMTCLYDNFSKRNVRKENGVFVNRDGEVISIVHANGNSKQWL